MLRTPLAIVILHCLVIIYGLQTYMHAHAPDPRVSDWWLFTGWTPLFTILSVYLIMVPIGPKLMENRPAYQLTTVLKCYNVIQVTMSAYHFKEFLLGAIEARYGLGCQPVDYSNSAPANRMAAACWWFFFSKVVDTLDTMFFILRKKNSQVTFLHVYHHWSMILNWYFAVRYAAGGQLFFQCLLNSFVHVVMYTYYFLAAFGPSVQKYLWWKKYLTQLQLIQFILIILHFVNGMTATCEFPVIANYYAIGYVFTIGTLFVNFYYETYSRQMKDRKMRALQLESYANGKCSDLFVCQKPMIIVNREPIFCTNNFALL